MTREQAKSELEQLYMSLSEEKKKALDVAFKAMEQSMPTMVYPQVDGITPTVVAQADGEKTCGNCRNEDTYHCAECENKSDYEQAQAEVNAHVIQSALDNGTNTVIGTAQADGEYISRTAIKYINAPIAPIIQGEEVHYEWVAFRNQIEQLPSVAIPNKVGHWEWVQYDYNPKIGNWHCTECRCIVVECVDKNEKGGIPLYKYCPQCGAKMIEPQESEEV